MAIKQIQLRGISRAPSDRITEDGGVAESLNMQLDNTECAPIMQPEVVNEQYNLPTDKIYKVILIHSGIGYTNVICQEGRNIGVWEKVDDKWSLRPYLTLSANEEVQSSSTLGNSVIIGTAGNLYYLLRKGDEYKFLGTNVPMPIIQLYDKAPSNKPNLNTTTVTLITNKENPSNQEVFQSWNTYANDSSGKPFNTNETVIGYIRRAWREYKSIRNRSLDSNAFTTPIFAKYAIKLKTGEYIDSDPFLIGGGLRGLVAATGTATVSADNKWTSTMKITSNCCYHLAAKLFLPDEFLKLLEDWKDVVDCLDIFISTDIFPAEKTIDEVPTDSTNAMPHPYNYVNAQTTANVVEGNLKGYDSVINFGNFDDATYEKILLSKSVFYLVQSFQLVTDENQVNNDVINTLRNGTIISTENVMNNADRVLKEQLPYIYRAQHGVTAKNILTYNSRVVLSDVSSTLPNGPSSLVGFKARDTYDPSRSGSDAISFRFKFYVRGEGKVLTKVAESANGKDFYIGYNIDGNPYTWLTYPDSRCFKVSIQKKTRTGEIYCQTFDMKEHPNLPIAYLFLGANVSYGKAITAKEDVNFNEENAAEEELGKVYVSSAENPFVFPLEGRYTVGSSRVIGAAIATKALSQGQFGQYPLYVFTEDGIWAMETGADGSFVSSKPVSRDVCVNPKSITSIDENVVYVNDKGLMMLSGSQTINLSPNMNGRHFIIDDKAKEIVSNQQGFDLYENTISDETPFLAFLKKATIGYDYPGNRLICIASDEEFQYVYKLDTQTWHKSKHEKNLVRAINRYPFCLGESQYDPIPECYINIDRGTATKEDYTQVTATFFPDWSTGTIEAMWYNSRIEVKNISTKTLEGLSSAYEEIGCHLIVEFKDKIYALTLYDLTTTLDSTFYPVEKSIIITRPFDLGEPDVFKTITDVRVRGQYPKGAVKFILEGSDDGVNFHVLNSLRGKAWKLFRLTILADLDMHDRISWVDIEYETKFTNRLR